MTTYKVRLSPSGKLIGNPALLAGPGSIGRTWRKHGVDSAYAVPPILGIAAAGIPSLWPIDVDMRPGYLYDLQVNYVIQSTGLTATATYATYYRLQEAVTSAWGTWVPMISGVHSVPELAVNAGSELFEGDMARDVSVPVACNAMQFGIAGNAAAGLNVLPFASWGRITEYLSAAP